MQLLTWLQWARLNGGRQIKQAVGSQCVQCDEIFPATCTQTRTELAHAPTGLQVSALDLKVEVPFPFQCCVAEAGRKWLGVNSKGAGSGGVRTSCIHTQLVDVVEVLR
jgi:hypothetical protein